MVLGCHPFGKLIRLEKFGIYFARELFLAGLERGGNLLEFDVADNEQVNVAEGSFLCPRHRAKYDTDLYPALKGR